MAIVKNRVEQRRVKPKTSPMDSQLSLADHTALKLHQREGARTQTFPYPWAATVYLNSTKENGLDPQTFPYPWAATVYLNSAKENGLDPQTFPYPWAATVYLNSAKENGLDPPDIPLSLGGHSAQRKGARSLSLDSPLLCI